MRSDFNPRYRHSVNLEGNLQPVGRTSIGVRVRNLSLGGAMIELPYRLVPGQPCVLRLALRDKDVPLEAHVVWSQVTDASQEAAEADRVACRSGLHFDPLLEHTEICLRDSLANLVQAHSPTTKPA